ncbi:MAG: DUF1049 domain-containing protein [Acidimicrobiia bacterium]|nr:DUF1049 domain-containing protein [Acidimicrobiia bacterium]
MSTDSHSSTPTGSAPSRRWFGPALLLALVVTPVVILIVSNPDTVTLAWAGYEWEAPGWLVYSATFVAGAVGGKLFGWLWRSWRRRRRHLADQRDVARRVAGNQGG